MRIKFTLLLMLSFLSYSSFGQLADDSLAPDFTITDIEGNEHNLYDILDEGKTVIMDVFATWCGPCWSYHQSHVLGDIYEAYGPDGENDMFVIAVEADGSTPEGCIYGPTDCSSTTLGDWTEGVPYPISNNSQINGLYNINFFPTIYIIFPNRMVRELGQLSYEDIVAYRDNIPQLSSGLNPEVISFRGHNGGTCNNIFATAPYFLLSNMGEETISSADISVLRNGEEVFSMEVEEDVPGYGIVAEIQINPSLVSENTVYELKMENINGDPSQSYSTGSSVTLETNNTIKVYAETDGQSVMDNNRYEILDEDYNIVASSDLAENNASIGKTHYLTEGGCYTLRVYDEGQDGVDGSISVADGNGNLIFQSSGAFGIVEQQFNVKTVSAIDQTLSENSFSINENPIGEELILELNAGLTGKVNVCVLNVYGQIMEHETLRNQSRISFDTKAWTNGIYFVNIQNDQSKVTKQVVKQ